MPYMHVAYQTTPIGLELKAQSCSIFWYRTWWLVGCV